MAVTIRDASHTGHYKAVAVMLGSALSNVLCIIRLYSTIIPYPWLNGGGGRGGGLKTGWGKQCLNPTCAPSRHSLLGMREAMDIRLRPCTNPVHSPPRPPSLTSIARAVSPYIDLYDTSPLHPPPSSHRTHDCIHT